MTASGTRRTVWCVSIPYALRAIGVAALATIVGTIFATQPEPGLTGDGLWVTLAWTVGLTAVMAPYAIHKFRTKS